MDMRTWVETFDEFNRLYKKQKDLTVYCFSNIVFSGEMFRIFFYAFANILEANFKGVCFRDCVFTKISLTDCVFDYAEFHNCTFDNVYISRCSFRGANLINSDFNNIQMAKVNFNCNRVVGCEFKQVTTDEDTSFFNLMCPEEGSFIGYKKAILYKRGGGNYYEEKVLVKIRITEDAKRSSATSHKCRASKVQVLEFMRLKQDENDFTRFHIIDEDFKLPSEYGVCSSHDPSFVYKLGAVIEVTNFDENRWNECAEGIHFFMNKNMARDYYI